MTVAGAAAAKVAGVRTGLAWRTWSASTVAAVTIAAAATVAAAFEATALTPAESAPVAAVPAAPVAAVVAAAPAAAPPPALAVVPSWASISFLRISSGPIGSISASARLVSRSDLRNTGAAFAVAQVAAHRGSQPRESLGDLAELLAHLLAGQLARLGGLGERDAGADQQRLHARDGGLHRLGDLLVGERVDLAQQQRGALRLRELADVGDQLAELLAVVDRVGDGPAVVGDVVVEVVDADRRLAAHVVQRAVARDPVEPRLEVDRALVGDHRAIGGGEGLLQHVLGVLLGAEHVAREREQPRVVARDQHLVRRLVAAPGDRDQPFVRLQAQERAGPAHARNGDALQCRDFHVGTSAKNTAGKRTLRCSTRGFPVLPDRLTWPSARMDAQAGSGGGTGRRGRLKPGCPVRGVGVRDPPRASRSGTGVEPAQQRARIERRAAALPARLGPQLEVQVALRGTARRPDVAEPLAGEHAVADLDLGRRAHVHVGVRAAARPADDDVVPGRPVRAGELHDALGVGGERRAAGGEVVGSLVAAQAAEALAL